MFLANLNSNLTRFVSFTLALVATPVAFAMPIGTSLDGELDFRAAEYSACESLNSCTVGNTSLFAFNEDGPALIYQDTLDGLGIRGGQETDEIDGFNAEQLVLEFSSPEAFLGIWFSDLFAGGNDPVEIANTQVILSDNSILQFMTSGIDLPGTSNGEVYQDFGGSLLISSIRFGTPSTLNDDHSVAGLVRGDDQVAVPEPAVGWMMTIGLVGLMLRRRQQRNS